MYSLSPSIMNSGNGGNVITERLINFTEAYVRLERVDAEVQPSENVHERKITRRSRERKIHDPSAGSQGKPEKVPSPAKAAIPHLSATKANGQPPTPHSSAETDAEEKGAAKGAVRRKGPGRPSKVPKLKVRLPATRSSRARNQKTEEKCPLLTSPPPVGDPVIDDSPDRIADRITPPSSFSTFSLPRIPFEDFGECSILLQPIDIPERVYLDAKTKRRLASVFKPSRSVGRTSGAGSGSTARTNGSASPAPVENAEPPVQSENLTSRRRNSSSGSTTQTSLSIPPAKRGVPRLPVSEKRSADSDHSEPGAQLEKAAIDTKKGKRLPKRKRESEKAPVSVEAEVTVARESANSNKVKKTKSRRRPRPSSDDNTGQQAKEEDPKKPAKRRRVSARTAVKAAAAEADNESYCAVAESQGSPNPLGPEADTSPTWAVASSETTSTSSGIPRELAATASLSHNQLLRQQDTRNSAVVLERMSIVPMQSYLDGYLPANYFAIPQYPKCAHCTCTCRVEDEAVDKNQPLITSFLERKPKRRRLNSRGDFSPMEIARRTTRRSTRAGPASKTQRKGDGAPGIPPQKVKDHPEEPEEESEPLSSDSKSADVPGTSGDARLPTSTPRKGSRKRGNNAPSIGEIIDIDAQGIDAGTPIVDAEASVVDTEAPVVDAEAPAVDAEAPVVPCTGPPWASFCDKIVVLESPLVEDETPIVLVESPVVGDETQKDDLEDETSNVCREEGSASEGGGTDVATPLPEEIPSDNAQVHPDLSQEKSPLVEENSTVEQETSIESDKDQNSGSEVKLVLEESFVSSPDKCENSDDEAEVTSAPEKDYEPTAVIPKEEPQPNGVTPAGFTSRMGRSTSEDACDGLETVSDTSLDLGETTNLGEDKSKEAPEGAEMVTRVPSVAKDGDENVSQDQSEKTGSNSEPASERELNHSPQDDGERTAESVHIGALEEQFGGIGEIDGHSTKTREMSCEFDSGSRNNDQGAGYEASLGEEGVPDIESRSDDVKPPVEDSRDPEETAVDCSNETRDDNYASRSGSEVLCFFEVCPTSDQEKCKDPVSDASSTPIASVDLEGSSKTKQTQSKDDAVHGESVVSEALPIV